MILVPQKIEVLFLLLRKFGFMGSIGVLWNDILYDYRKGVDTYAPIAGEDLFEGERLKTQNRYLPSPFSMVDVVMREVKKELGSDFSEIGFIDYGSGKGKILIAAVKYGFKRITGVEYSTQVHDVAVRNMQKLGLTDKITLVNGDATEFRPQPDDRVFYMFNPFMGEILEGCLRQIKSVKAQGKRILVVANPVEDERFQKHFTKVVEGKTEVGQIHFCVYVD